MMGHRQYEFKSNLHPPFALSTFHLLRSCNRLILSNSGQLIMPENTELQSATYYNAKAAITNVTQSNMNYTLDMLNNVQHSPSDEAINVLDEEQENTACTTAPPPTQSRVTTITSMANTNNCDKSRELFRNYEIDSGPGAFGKTPLPAFEYIAPTKPAFHLTSLPPIFDIHRLPGIFPNFMQRRTRGEKRIIPDELKDDKYFERRKRNNEAAKKSRDARKIREDRNAFRAALLEQENSILRAQVLALRDELTTLKQLIATTTTTMALNQSNLAEKDLL